MKENVGKNMHSITSYMNPYNFLIFFSDTRKYVEEEIQSNYALITI